MTPRLEALLGFPSLGSAGVHPGGRAQPSCAEGQHSAFRSSSLCMCTPEPHHSPALSFSGCWLRRPVWVLKTIPQSQFSRSRCRYHTPSDCAAAGLQHVGCNLYSSGRGACSIQNANSLAGVRMKAYESDTWHRGAVRPGALIETTGFPVRLVALVRWPELWLHLGDCAPEHG